MVPSNCACFRQPLPRGEVLSTRTIKSKLPLIILSLGLVIFSPSTSVLSYSNYNHEDIYQQQVDPKEQQCLAEAIYFEARGAKTIEGKKAVAHVVLNRQLAYNKTTCAVVYDACQFSWVCYTDSKDKKKRTIRWTADTKKPIREKAIWEQCLALAFFELSEYNNRQYHDNLTGGALFFHGAIAQPSWQKIKIHPTAYYDGHIFYRNK